MPRDVERNEGPEDGAATRSKGSWFGFLPAVTPTESVVMRVREVAKRRGLSVRELADRLEPIAPQLNPQAVLANLLAGRRKAVDVSELFALAMALDVAPVHLMAPIDDEWSIDVGGGRPCDATAVRNWVRGINPLEDTDPRLYFSEVPLGEYVTVQGPLTVAEGGRPWRALIGGGQEPHPPLGCPVPRPRQQAEEAVLCPQGRRRSVCGHDRGRQGPGCRPSTRTPGRSPSSPTRSTGSLRRPSILNSRGHRDAAAPPRVSRTG